MPLVQQDGAGWLDRRVFRNEVKTSAALFAGALACLLVLPAAQGFGWGAVLVLWAVMAGTALAVCLLLARRWGRFVLECETERGERI